MKKYCTVFLVCCLITMALFAGGKKEPSAAPSADQMDKAAKTALTVKVAVPSGAPAVCIAYMADSSAVTENTLTEYEVLQTPDVLQARLIAGEADIAVVPSNLAAVLYAKGVPIRFAGAVIWGVLYGLSTEPISSIQDLKGKNILTFGRGLTPDITVREILKSYNLIPDTDVTFTYVQSGQEAAAAFISGKFSYAILPEPMVSTILTKKPDAKVFLDVQAAWKEKLGGDMSYPQAVVVVQKKLIENHPKYVAWFLSELERSILWAKENPDQAGEAVAKIQKGMAAPVIAKGVSRMNLQFSYADSTRPALEKYFLMLEKANPKFIGGSLPQDDFYYIPVK